MRRLFVLNVTFSILIYYSLQNSHYGKFIYFKWSGFTVHGNGLSFGAIDNFFDLTIYSCIVVTTNYSHYYLTAFFDTYIFNVLCISTL